jgi:hypothetical protein
VTVRADHVTAAGGLEAIRGAVEAGESARRFAGPDHGRAALTVRPAGASDVAVAFAHAAGRGLPVAIRGAGHAMTGAAVAAGGILIDNQARPPRLSWRGDDEIEVSSSARWVEVEAELNRRGRTFPVLTDYLGMTVGGTLAVGGYGVRGVVAGCQLDHVREACLVFPSGEVRWCSRARHAELFSMSLASGGSLAYIDAVRLETAPLRREVRLRTFRHEGLAELGHSLGWTRDSSRAWPCQLDATYFRRTGLVTSRYGDPDAGTIEWILDSRLFAGRSVEDRTYGDYHMVNHRHVGAWAEGFRGWNRWADYVLDLPALQQFLCRLEALRASPVTGRFLECIYVVGIRRRAARFSFVFEASGRRPDDIEFLLGIYYMLPPGESASVPAVEEEIAGLLAACIALGGRPYLHGWNALSDRQIASLYGDEYQAFLLHKRQFDPGSVLPLPSGARATTREHDPKA